MAQRIWLIRHGKSSRPFGVVDHQRPLAKRASGDAALIRRHLADAPERFVPSTARRALETAELIAGGKPVAARAELYFASAEEFLAVVEDELSRAGNVAFVGHNPTITDLANRLAGKTLAESVPTLGAAEFKRRRGGWTLASYATPKQLR